MKTNALIILSAHAGDNSTDVPLFKVPRVELWSAVMTYLIYDLPRSTALFSHGFEFEFAHFRVASLFWGFPDDVYVRMTCTDEGLAALELQGNLRIGHGDMGVNADRNAKLLQHIREVEASGTLSVGNCGLYY